MTNTNLTNNTNAKGIASLLKLKIENNQINIPI